MSGRQPAPGHGDQGPTNDALAALYNQGPPTTPEQARQQMNLIQRVLSEMDPDSEQLAAIITILEKIRQQLDQGVPAKGGGGSGSSGQQHSSIRQQLDRLLKGQLNSTALPKGSIGQTHAPIKSGENGIAHFQILGMPFHANVKASRHVRKFQQVVVKGKNNTVEPLSHAAQNATGTSLSDTGTVYDTISEPVQDASPGKDAHHSEGVVRLALGPLRTNVDLLYNVTGQADNIYVEARASSDEDWRYLFTRQSENIPPDGQEREHLTVPELEVRAYAGSGFSNSDVDLVRLVAKGT